MAETITDIYTFEIIFVKVSSDEQFVRRAIPLPELSDVDERTLYVVSSIKFMHTNE